ncbi:hypothetical protein PFLU3_57140 [Pseudomonas fluorescens]|uniref:Uncharacterized protein n=1 Tax=Pseudomonas fluorescens TaxID=294 RepID=A0A0D0SXV5_PSEFL|nr:hypothetical protein PFLU3_57140 [Pseudomonas fluorescens]
MVHGQQQDMLLVIELEQLRAQQRAVGQVKGLRRFLADQHLGACQALVFGPGGQIDQRQGAYLWRVNMLVSLALHHREGGAQCFMAFDHSRECLL